ncbi:craniofacial development protein 2-like [Mytilus edulis]|uniref:craniofacial development protein 2-like n=1 Tax=Mytilus edulis TaxID=6550 RepID=UPI0039EF784C
MEDISKAAQVAKEMKNNGMDILGISESRWKGAGETKLQSGDTVIYVGDDEHQVKGVAIMMNERAEKLLMEWTPINKRMIKARFYSKYKKLTVIQAYAPTNDAKEEEKEEFYQQLQDNGLSCNKNDMLIVMGDLNLKVGKDNSHMQEVLGKHGYGTINENGELLCNFCQINGLIITGSIFPHKEIHKVTWKSPDGKTTNQIDQIMIRGDMRTSILDTRVMRGADVYTDHYLVRSNIRLKLARNKGDKNKCKREI